MFKSKTVFIVGAGASHEAGLPVGDQLKNEIVELLNFRFNDENNRLSSGDAQILQVLRQCSLEATGYWDANSYLLKAYRIKDEMPIAISIDNFLDAHRGDEKIEICGKLAIVKSILLAEHNSLLKGEPPHRRRFNTDQLTDTWFVQFFRLLTENIPKVEADTVFENVAFVTFNYDRCIEHYLAQQLGEYYEITEHESQKIVSRLAIYHPYGTVGALPWQAQGRGVQFGSTDTDLLEAAARIKTFTEGMADEALMPTIHDAISDAHTVVFLGFAFHPMNIDLLKVGKSAETKRIFATTFGISRSDQDVVRRDIRMMLGQDAFDSAHVEFVSATCHDFFRDYFRSLRG